MPPSIHVVLRASRVAGTAIGMLAAATIALTLATPLPPAPQMAAVVAIIVWAGLAFYGDALHRGRYAVTEVRLAPDLILVAYMADGRLVAGHVRASTYVGSWLTTIVWRPDGARWSRTILLLPDMLPADDFRRLRVMLRYARSGDSQDAPASQA